MGDYIPLEECRIGYFYEIKSRNLSYGVFDGKEGFIGIREKFGSKYLFKEYHWDQGPPFGTVRPLVDLNLRWDGDLAEGFGTISEDGKRQWKQNDGLYKALEEIEQLRTR